MSSSWGDSDEVGDGAGAETDADDAVPTLDRVWSFDALRCCSDRSRSSFIIRVRERSRL